MTPNTPNILKTCMIVQEIIESSAETPDVSQEEAEEEIKKKLKDIKKRTDKAEKLINEANADLLNIMTLLFKNWK